jgi:hypothetical protein|tara:strand:- start:91 stop:636 length:546 start_codon:yes stop_codon:yes gene_type:complete
MKYKPQIAIIGSRNLNDSALIRVENLSLILVDNGFRIVTGGLGSLQKSTHRGAKKSNFSGDGDTIAILPGFDPKPAIGFADIIIPTGLDLLRNVLVANSDVVICVNGGSGTLSEIAFAWQMNRPIISVGEGGWSSKLIGEKIDHRFPQSEIINCEHLTSFEVVEIVKKLVSENRERHGGII